jgi:hypothetical protein
MFGICHVGETHTLITRGDEVIALQVEFSSLLASQYSCISEKCHEFIAITSWLLISWGIM